MDVIGVLFQRCQFYWSNKFSNGTAKTTEIGQILCHSCVAESL